MLLPRDLDRQVSFSCKNLVGFRHPTPFGVPFRMTVPVNTSCFRWEFISAGT